MKQGKTKWPWIVIAGLCSVVVLDAAVALLADEPDYLNFFGQRVSAVVALLSGFFAIMACWLGWRRRGEDAKGKRRRRSKSLVVRRTASKPLGRNERCHCGSGKKYKKCCLQSDEDRFRRHRLSQQSAQLNRSNAVVSGAAMANRGLSSQ